jgi:hypothetical protein
MTSPSPLNARPLSGNPYLDEIDSAVAQGHANLSPPAQEAVSRSGVAPALLGLVPPTTQPTPAVAPLAAPRPAMRGLASTAPPELSGASGPTSAAPLMPMAMDRPLPPAQPLLSARPLSQLSPTETEYNRLHHVMTPAELAQGGPHTHLNTGASGLEQIHSPWARVPLEILNAIGTGFAPRLTSAIPGTPLHHQAVAAENEDALKTEQGVANEEQRRGLEGAQTSEAEARAEAARNPKTATAKEPTNAFEAWDQKHKDDPNYNPEDWLKLEENAKFHEPNEYADFKAEALKENPNAKIADIVKAFATAKGTAQPKEGNDFEQYYQRYLGDNKLTDSAANRLKARKDYEAAGQKPAQPPGVTVMVPNAQGGYDVQRASTGQSVPGNAVTTAGMNTANTPPTQMRQAAAQATLVHQETPRVLASIDKNAAQLGPVAGRWNEFMQGKVGMDNPALADLRADLLMYSSAVALAHARGRLPENLRQEFENAINAPKQTPTNLKATISRIDQWMADNAASFGGHQATGGAPPGRGPAVGTVEGGYRFKGGDPANKANWQKQ